MPEMWENEEPDQKQVIMHREVSAVNVRSAASTTP